MYSPVQAGRVEGHALISCKGTKSQLAVEQPSTGGCWNPSKTNKHTKKKPCPKTKLQQRRSYDQMVGGVQAQ